MKNLDFKTLAEFNIGEVKSIAHTENKNTWIANDKYVISVYAGKTDDDVKNLERMILINNGLYNLGVPVFKYHEAGTGRFYVKANDDCYTLADKMPGSASYVDGSHKERAFMLGKSIAKLHLGLKELTGKIEGCWDNDFMKEFHGWISRELKDKAKGIKQEVFDYLSGFEKLYRKLPRQIIHRNLGSWNILIDNDKVSAFVNIDMAQINIRIFDLCYLVSFLPVKEDEEIKWFEVYKNLLSGYNAVSEFSSDELEALPYMHVFVDALWNAYELMTNGSTSSEYSIDNGLWSYNNRSKFLFTRQDII